MRIAPIVCALVLAIGCSKKKQAADPPPAGSGTAAPAGSGTAAPAAADAAAPVAAADAAEAPAPADAATTAAAGKVCCCQTVGDAMHYTVERSETICTGDGLEGDCVALDECELKSEPVVLVVDQPVTVTSPGLVAGWNGAEKDSFVPIDIKLSAKGAAVTVMGAGDKWKPTGKVPVDGTNPITITAKADGTAVISNGAASWVLAQEFRYGDTQMKKQ